MRTKGMPQGFSEHLELTENNGVFHQTYYVCRPPHGYVCKRKIG